MAWPVQNTGLLSKGTNGLFREEKTQEQEGGGGGEVEDEEFSISLRKNKKVSTINV